MRKIFIAAGFALLLSACQSASKDQSAVGNTTDTTQLSAEDAPKVEVEKPVFEFGVIKQGEKVQHEFKFKNTGKSPLIITNASATCGCTVPEYPTEPILPGKEGSIKVIFNSEGKIGLQDKVVTISSNANPAFEQLHLVGDIVENK